MSIEYIRILGGQINKKYSKFFIILSHHFLFNQPKMISRNDYENLFIQNGISRSELCMMTNAEFQKKLRYFLSNSTTNQSNSNSVNSQYRYISPKLYAEREARMRRESREPSFNNERESEHVNSNYPDYSQYQQYDEEAALQAAIQSSLQDQINQSATSQEENFKNQNNESINKEDETEKQNQETASSSTYSHVYKKSPSNERIAQTAEQRLFDEQTTEFQRMEEEAFKKEMEENISKHFEENEKEIEREEIERKIGEVVSKYYSLKPEPQTGVTVAVNMSNQRIIRKFDPNSKGEDVYAWVAIQTIDEEDDEDKLFFDNFELHVNGIGVVSPEKTLAEQGIKGRVMMNIISL